MDFFLTAFFDLNTTRQIGDSEGAISWLAVDRYGSRHGVDGLQWEDLWHHVSYLDAAYLKHRRTKAQKKADAGQQGKGSGQVA